LLGESPSEGNAIHLLLQYAGEVAAYTTRGIATASEGLPDVDKNRTVTEIMKGGPWELPVTGNISLM
jgi:hypothetical protein